VETISTQSIINSVKRASISRSTSLTKLKESFTENSEIEQLHLTISLICPITKLKIETPVRSKQCNHLQCFDLDSFVESNKASPTWKCPVCFIHTQYDDLSVDEYFSQILEKIKDDEERESIKIFKDGEWEFIDSEFTSNHSSSDDDDDDDATSPPPTKSRKLSSHHLIAHSKEFDLSAQSSNLIDLTL